MINNKIVEVEWYDAVSKNVPNEIIDSLKSKLITGKDLLAINKSYGKLITKNKDVIIIEYETSTATENDCTIIPVGWVISVRYLK